MARNRDEGMFRDSLAWGQMSDLDEAFIKGRTEQLRQPIIQFVTKYCQGQVGKLHDPISGTYNTVWRLDFQHGGSVCFRVPKPGSVTFPDEKTRIEAATLRYIAEKTSIPDSPTGLGAFIIMDYVKHHQTLNSVLLKELEDQLDEMMKQESYVLKNYPPSKNMVHAYREMASILLQLSRLEMPKLGSLAVNGDSYEVATRPLPQDINDLPRNANYPKHLLPPEDKTYSSSHEWYSLFADRHITQLIFQHNDAVESEADCRDKLVARYLFRHLIRNRKYPQAAAPASTDGSEPEVFKFWCDDLRPNSVLVDEDMKIVGVIDWEWSYFAPSSFASDPPWWLMITKPDFDIIDFDSWCERYPIQLDVFLKVLEEEERKSAETAESSSVKPQMADMSIRDTDGKPLSVRMRENWDSGAFWVNFAARKPYSFEPMFWKQIDERFFGPNPRGGYEDRLSLLPERARREMEWLVARKMKEDREHRLVDWTEHNARSYVRAVFSSFR
ncbi:phosphotransferase family protein [Coniochaeta ligniaria NRRL 30616]|uniref:Phosphotransferase family protein n=1 Tax=Coniochaeta ligniaria NRRL 30616 TaxID=1408157 RepID=A0A1J7K1A8_9PEZI|nr:phosphotransferase family protein [Coniochaeta ligniaria NRRL 30616]